MPDDLLARVFTSQWSVFLIVSLLLLLLAEAGYRFGTSFRRHSPGAAEGHSGTVQGAVLGLLGLLLGFSFAMAVGRYDTRRALVVAEANSIGTTWLRADLLPAPHDKEVKSLLERYTRLRVDSRAALEDSAAMEPVRQEVAAIHNALWLHAVAAAKEAPSPLVASFITTLNETIDLDSSRLAALRNRVPGAVWLLLLAVAGCGAWASGYSSGTGGLRSAFSELVFPVLIGIVITLTADIDRPSKGIIGISQRPLQDLLEGMHH